MDARHTPGPWTMRDTHDMSHEISSEHIRGRVLATVHAPMVMNSDNEHEEAANASLIAAAPELLAALTDLLIDQHIDICPASFKDSPHECLPICRSARAAMEKAKGPADVGR